jgi:hypothetical protein
MPASAVPASPWYVAAAGTGARRINRALRSFLNLSNQDDFVLVVARLLAALRFLSAARNTRRIRGRHSWVSRRSKQAIGFPGTMGAEFIDYVIADKTVAPFDQRFSFTCRITIRSTT